MKCSKEAELISRTITVSKKNMVISSFYRPPSNTDESYQTKVHEELQQLRSASKKSVFILGGDFNVPDISWKENSITSSKHYPRRVSQTFLDVASDLGLEQMVDFPTRGENTLNLIFTSHSRFQERCKPLPPISDKSDHDIVLFDTSHQPIRARPKRRTILLWKKADTEGIQKAFISYSDRFFSTTFYAVNSMWEDIKTTIDQVIKDRVPTKRTAARHTQQRRYMDRLSMLFKIQNGLVDISPEFVQRVDSRTRGSQRIQQLEANKDVYRYSFYPRTISDWNRLHILVTNSQTIL